VEIANEQYLLTPISRTFHGRDVFSPSAAHLASGVPLEELGPPVATDALVRLEVPRPEVAGSRIRATVLYVDRFGNVQLNLTAADLADAGIEPGGQVEVEAGFERYFAVAARTFADVRSGDIMLYEDSYRNVALAISGGSASEMFGTRPGQTLRITRPQ
jgi:S-adenosylmethionine hydrolase